MRLIENKIKEELESYFSPEYMIITNESHKHKGHAGDNGTGESHFHVIIVTNKFQDKTRLARTRMVHIPLHDLLKDHIHALSLSLLTPTEYQTKV